MKLHDTIAACRHCQTVRYIKSRGLCWPCWSDPAIFKQYPPRAYRSDGIPQASASPLPATPTSAPAGSLEKMKVMAQRAVRGERLDHPDDNSDCRPEYPFENEQWTAGMPTGLESENCVSET